ncbi:MAG TPA: SLC13 family permease [Thermomicrobiales bacterium]|nr:SLC13 family permease [Thermomicrobiales bacterium]
MPDLSAWLVLAIVALTLALILIRPRDLNEAWIASGGAIAMLLAGVVRPEALPGVVSQTAGVLLFLLGMMVLTGIVERAGIFDLVAERCADFSFGNGIALYVLLFLFGAIVTALLSLDVTIIMLTPIVYAVTKRRGMDPLPFLFACTFVANTASLVFPFSNLTNLLLYEPLGLSFRQFTSAMWLPNMVAMLTNLALFLWLFRSRIPRHLPAILMDEPGIPAPNVASRGWRRKVAVLLVISLSLLFACGFAGLPLWWAALAGATLAFIPALITHRTTLAQTAADISWPLFVFVIAMTVLVRGVERTWLADLTLSPPESNAGAVATGVLSGAIGSNVINNVPMAVLARSVLERMPVENQPVLAYSVLVGTNIGPALTTYGSLATMLWLTLVRQRGMTITTRSYLAISLITVPIVLLTTSISLWLVVR